jgi:hypothetical protein
MAVPDDEATNTAADFSGRFFSKNFCHPENTMIWEENVYMCMSASNDD